MEFAWTGVGPAPGTYLASMGATVIRIESGTRPDPLRTMGPFKDGVRGLNRSAFYNAANTNKLGFALNMKHPKALDIARKLIAWADVLSEAYTPGTMKKWCLDYEEVKKINPEIIYYSTSMAGQDGPYSALPGFGAQLTGMTGFTLVTGWPDRLPAIPYGAYTDFINIKLAIFVLLAAIDYKRRTGKGHRIDLAQYEGGILFLAPLMLDYFVNGKVAQRKGNRDPGFAPHGVYRCAGDDQWCALAVASDGQWHSFCGVIGNPEWSAQPKFKTLPGRIADQDELDMNIEQWTKNHSATEVMKRMQAAGIAAGVVNKASDTFTDPQLTERQAYRKVIHPEMGEHFAFNITAGSHFSKIQSEVRRPSPCIGEHNDFVCTQLLGMTADEVQACKNEGVFE